MPKTGGEYRAQALGELQRYRPNAIGFLILAMLADINPINILRDSARKVQQKGKK